MAADGPRLQRRSPCPLAYSRTTGLVVAGQTEGGRLEPCHLIGAGGFHSVAVEAAGGGNMRSVLMNPAMDVVVEEKPQPALPFRMTLLI